MLKVVVMHTCSQVFMKYTRVVIIFSLNFRRTMFVHGALVCNNSTVVVLRR